MKAGKVVILSLLLGLLALGGFSAREITLGPTTSKIDLGNAKLVPMKAEGATLNGTAVNLSYPLSGGGLSMWSYTAGQQFFWANKFTPAASEFPFLLNKVEVVQYAYGGDPIDIIIVSETTGSDMLAGGTILYQGSFTVENNDPSNLYWEAYNINPPVRCEGPGDIYVIVALKSSAEHLQDSYALQDADYVTTDFIGYMDTLCSVPPPDCSLPDSWDLDDLLGLSPIFIPPDVYPQPFLIRASGVTYDTNLSVTSVSYIDSCWDGGPGDDDYIIDPGETVEVFVTVKNLGPAVAKTISAMLIPSFSGVRMVSNRFEIPQLTAGASYTGSFVFEASYDAQPCGAEMPFTVDIRTDPSISPNTWSEYFSLTLGEPDPGPVSNILVQNFESWPPAGWALTGELPGWEDGLTHGHNNNPFSDRNMTGGSGDFAICDTDVSEFGFEAYMTSPTFSLDGSFSSAQLEFKSDWWVSGYYQAFGRVELSTDGGSTWNIIGTPYNGDTSVRGPHTETINLTAYKGNANCKLRWHFWDEGYDWHWQVDEIKVQTKEADGPCVWHKCPLPFRIFCPSPIYAYGNTQICVDVTDLAAFGSDPSTGYIDLYFGGTCYEPYTPGNNWTCHDSILVARLPGQSLPYCTWLNFNNLIDYYGNAYGQIPAGEYILYAVAHLPDGRVISSAIYEKTGLIRPPCIVNVYGDIWAAPTCDPPAGLVPHRVEFQANANWGSGHYYWQWIAVGPDPLNPAKQITYWNSYAHGDDNVAVETKVPLCYPSTTQVYNIANPIFTFKDPGEYLVTLIVTDTMGYPLACNEHRYWITPEPLKITVTTLPGNPVVPVAPSTRIQGNKMGNSF